MDNKTISRTEAVRRKFIILSATHIEIDKINKIGDRENPNPLLIVDNGVGVKRDTPVRFYKTRKTKKDSKNNYEAGDFGRVTQIDKEKKELHIHLDRDEDVIIPVKNLTQGNKKNIIVKKAYSITYHAVQGKTISEHCIALNLINMFDKNMKYVGVSRATEEGNIYILETDS